MPTVSIVTPVYNVEKYIFTCIDSILSQTYKDFELILVDDGSSDRSGDICDKYAKTDKRIKVIHKVNEGVSAARRDGVNISSGKWIMFVDSDDIISSDCLENLTRYEYTGADIIEGSCVNFTNEDELSKINKDNVSHILYEANPIEYANGIMQYNKNIFFSTPWLKLIKASHLKGTDVLLVSKEITNGEDQTMCLRIGANKNFRKAIKINNIVYYYRLRKGSAMSNYIGDEYCKKLLSYISESIRLYDNKDWQKYAISRFCYETMITLIKKRRLDYKFFWVRRSFYKSSSLKSKLILMLILILPTNILYKISQFKKANN